MVDTSYVYILECNDKSYYTGWSLDPLRREYEHNNTKRGSKYVRGRRPAKLVYIHKFDDRLDAMKEEFVIKHTLSHAEKEILINSKKNQINEVIDSKTHKYK